MKLRYLGILMALGAVMGFAGPVLAQNPPVAANSTATLVGAPAVSVFLVPNGSGAPLSWCFRYPGTRTVASIQITLNGALGVASPGVPQTAIRLNHTVPGVSWCPYVMYPPPPHGPNCADAATDVWGNTQFTLTYHGGRWINTGSTVWVNQGGGVWAPITPPLPVHTNSSDMNGDGVVNLIDVADFASVFFGLYHYRADYNWDGVINIIDLGMLAPTIGATCP